MRLQVDAVGIGEAARFELYRSIDIRAGDVLEYLGLASVEASETGIRKRLQVSRLMRAVDSELTT